MRIDLTKLLEQGEILINEQFSFPDSYFIDSEIKELDPVIVNAKCILKDQEINLIGTISGKMKIVDAISLDLIPYSFSCKIEEVLEKKARNKEKSLDITDILWQNIVLEVPLKQTEVTDFSEYQGDGWKLVTEEEAKNTNNPFGELVNMWGEE